MESQIQDMDPQFQDMDPQFQDMDPQIQMMDPRMFQKHWILEFEHIFEIKNNRFQVLYVVTCNSRDMFSTMTRISIASLRLTNPRFKITIILDEISDEVLRKSSDPLLMEVDEVIIVFYRLVPRKLSR